MQAENYLDTVLIDVKSSKIIFVGDDGHTKTMIIENTEDLFAKIDFIEREGANFTITYVNNTEDVLLV